MWKAVNSSEASSVISKALLWQTLELCVNFGSSVNLLSSCTSPKPHLQQQSSSFLSQNFLEMEMFPWEILQTQWSVDVVESLSSAWFYHDKKWSKIWIHNVLQSFFSLSGDTLQTVKQVQLTLDIVKTIDNTSQPSLHHSPLLFAFESTNNNWEWCKKNIPQPLLTHTQILTTQIPNHSWRHLVACLKVSRINCLHNVSLAFQK